MTIKEYKTIMEYLKECEKIAYNKQVKAAGNIETAAANKEFLTVHKIVKMVKKAAEEENIIIEFDPLTITDENINENNIHLIDWEKLPDQLENKLFHFCEEDLIYLISMELQPILKYANNYNIDYSGCYDHSYINLNPFYQSNSEWINNPLIDNIKPFYYTYIYNEHENKEVTFFIEHVELFQKKLDQLNEIYYYYNSFPAGIHEKEYNYINNLLDNFYNMIENIFNKIGQLIIDAIHQIYNNNLYDPYYIKENIIDYCTSCDTFDLFAGYRYNKEKGLYEV